MLNVTGGLPIGRLYFSQFSRIIRGFESKPSFVNSLYPLVLKHLLYLEAIAKTVFQFGTLEFYCFYLECLCFFDYSCSRIFRKFLHIESNPIHALLSPPGIPLRHLIIHVQSVQSVSCVRVIRTLTCETSSHVGRVYNVTLIWTLHKAHIS